MDVLRALFERLNLRIALYWIVLIGAAWVFVELADEVYEREGFFFDGPILAWIYTLRTPVLNELMVALSTIGSLEVMAPISLIGAVFLWHVKRREGNFFTFSMGGAVLIMVITKYVLARERPFLFPDVNLWQEASPSFPSGHATGSFALFLTILLIARRYELSWGWLVTFLGGFFAFSVSFSRLYLQVHYPSDVLAGWALGAAWVLGVNYFFTRDRNVRNVLLTLPTETVEHYRQVIREEGTNEDAFVDQAIRKELEARDADVQDS